MTLDLNTRSARDGLSALERTVYRDEIRQLAYRYAYGVDGRDLDLLASLYVEDVRATRKTSGREAMRDVFSDSLSAIGVCVLFVGNHIIDFQDPEHATGIVYCHGWIDDGGPWIEQAIQYHDRYALRDGKWLFVRRKHLLVYGQTQPEHPLEQPLANWPANQVGRGSLPESEASWRAFWANRKFPGRPARG